MKRLLTLFIALIVSINITVKAEEGMWVLPLLEQLNIGEMTAMGFKLTAEELYSINQPSIAHAIVSFGGFCTGEIVSSKGLVFTNYHCGRGRVQQHSSVDHDYLKDGYWAKSPGEELSNPGLFVRFMVRMEDVSNKVLENVNEDMTEADRAAEIGRVREELIAAATDGTHYSAVVSSFFGGNNYYLIVYETFNDVRLVGAPPKSIGEYGGDTDNWEWPRHTGDFSIFRVYSGPDGKPAEYSEENIPLKPRYHLPLSLKGVEENDFAMTLGYAGRTSRYMTSYEIEENLSVTWPNRIKLWGTFLDLWLEDMVEDQKVYIQYHSKHNGFANYWKNAIGMKGAVENLNVKDQKLEIEERFTEWVNAKAKRKKKYGEALPLIKAAVDSRSKTNHLNQYLNDCFLNGTEITGFAMRGGRLLGALNDGDAEAIEEQTERLMGAAETFFKDYNPPTDKKAATAMFELYKEDISQDYWPAFFKTIDEKYNGSVKDFLDLVFKKSIFASEEKFNAFINDPSAEVIENDPAYKLIADIREVGMKIQNEADNTTRDKFTKGHRLYIAGLREMDPDVVRYPDANSSMRLSYGTVKPYQPKDAVIYKWYTSEKGIMEKYQPGHHEFDLKEKQIELINAENFDRYVDKNGYLPVCFLTTNDITGGNSGSPVINGNGELIGLAFDGNWEAMSGDIVFEENLQRCINVDIRYVLWVIDVFAGADNIIDELTIVE